MSKKFQSTGERYQDVPDIPSGEFEDRGFIGLGATTRLWDLGWNGKEGWVDGDSKPIPVGRVYRTGTKEEATEYQKREALNNNKFVTAALVTTMPLDSICNKPQDVMEKFKYPLQTGVDFVGLGKDYNQAGHIGLGLVVVPSFVDAFARFQGWYKEPLFNVGLFGQWLETTADASALIDKLAEQRVSIWKALGEAEWTHNASDTKSAQLKEALESVILAPWKTWVRLHIVMDPSHKAVYTSNVKGTVTRNRVQVVSQFFDDERSAIAVGKAEVEAQAKNPTPNGSTTSVYDQLSAMAKKSYDQPTWDATVGEVMAALKGGQAKPKVAKDYAVSVADLNLLDT